MVELAGRPLRATVAGAVAATATWALILSAAPERAAGHAALGELETALAGEPGGDFEYVAGLGMTRRAEGSGLLEVLLPTGQVVTTHGSDPHPRAAQAFPAAKKRSGKRRKRRKPRPPRCVGAHQPHLQPLYTYPAGAAGDLGSAERPIRKALLKMNGEIRKAARRSSGGRMRVDFTVQCTTRGKPVVHEYPSLLTSSHLDGFATIVSGAVLAGHTDPNAKYLIFYDDPAPPRCGAAQIFADDRRSVENLNNGGPMYAVLYGRDCWVDGRPALHESSHTMGAVQLSAPNSTTAFHCNDHFDVMCYADGGLTSRPSLVCRRQTYDCRANDYFDPTASTGYLATNWNLGWSGNRFLSIRRRPRR